MRTIVPAVLDLCRVRDGEYGSTERDGLRGAFKIAGLIVISTGPLQKGWEHVSTSLANRTPTWAEMCTVKNLFWAEEETVVQFHPRKSEYVNFCEHCLHLWKPPYALELPPMHLVGPVQS